MIEGVEVRMDGKQKRALDEVDQHIHRARAYVASARSARIWPFGTVLRRGYLESASEALDWALVRIGEIERGGGD